MTRLDPIEIMVRRVAVGLVRGGMSVESAAIEAEAVVEEILDALAREEKQDINIGKAIRQSRVYRLRSRGMTFTAICERLRIHRVTAQHDYKDELLRLRAS